MLLFSHENVFFVSLTKGRHSQLPSLHQTTLCWSLERIMQMQMWLLNTMWKIIQEPPLLIFLSAQSEQLLSSKVVFICFNVNHKPKIKIEKNVFLVYERKLWISDGRKPKRQTVHFWPHHQSASGDASADDKSNGFCGCVKRKWYRHLRRDGKWQLFHVVLPP